MTKATMCMKKKLVILQILYYAMNLIVYMAFFYTVSLLLNLSGGSDNLGFIMLVTYGMLFIMTPVLVAILMRFSLLQWYVDPIAALEIPFILYAAMIANHMKHYGNLSDAFLRVNKSLSNSGGSGWLFLIGLFLFGLIMSLSFERKKGQSISYRLLSKMSKTNEENI